MKIDIVKQKKQRFEKVDLREPLVKDFIAAERVAGGMTEGFRFSLALLAQIGTFDGEKKVMEDLESMDVSCFLALSSAMEQLGIADLGEQLSTSKEKESFPTQA